MRRARPRLACVLALLAASCGGGSSPTEPLPAAPTPIPTASPTPVASASLSGTVTERGSGTPVSGAQVAILDALRVTGADGSFSIQGLRVGPAPIVVTREGYLPGGKVLELVSGPNSVGLTLEPQSPEGACAFVKDGVAGCLPTTKAGCDALRGTWFEGAACTTPPPP